MKFTFSKDAVQLSAPVQIEGTADHIEMTPNLKKCSVANAYRFGGRLVRQALESAPFSAGFESVYVETVVTNLLTGHIPTQPGWHIDEIPSQNLPDPMQIAGMGYQQVLAAPSLSEMQDQINKGRTVQFHTLVLGCECPTMFVNEPLELDIEHTNDWGILQEIHEKVREAAPLKVTTFPNGRWTSFNWTNLHRPTQATTSGWRLLVRIVEGGESPQERDFMYPTHHVFVPTIQAL